MPHKGNASEEGAVLKPWRVIGPEAAVVATLVLATMLAILISVGVASSPLLLGWAIGWAVIGGVATALASSPIARLAFALVLVPLFVLLAFEGGFLMLPALLTLVAFEAIGLTRNRRARRAGRRRATP